MRGHGKGLSELRKAIANCAHGPGCSRTIEAFFVGGLAGGKKHVTSVIGYGDAVLLADQPFGLCPIQRDGGDFVTQRAVAWYFENDGVPGWLEIASYVIEGDACRQEWQANGDCPRRRPHVLGVGCLG
jgi:hypothetical protein